MAGKKNPRSSKTDHVLSLLTESTSEPAATSAPSASDAPAAPEAAAPVAERHLSPPILEVARTNNEALEETIHSALEDALQEELTQEEASSSTPAVPPQSEEADVVPAPLHDTDTVAESSAVEIPAIQEEAAPEASSITQEEMPAPSPEPAAVAASSQPLPYYRSLPDGTRFINVMLPLVEETLERYVTLFHLCDCPRCLADAQALALSRLPAKYVVLSEGAFTPMMSLYRAKYDSLVTTQVVYACKQIMDAPRH